LTRGVRGKNVEDEWNDAKLVCYSYIRMRTFGWVLT